MSVFFCNNKKYKDAGSVVQFACAGRLDGAGRRATAAAGVPQCQKDRPVTVATHSDRPAARRHEEGHMYTVLSARPEQLVQALHWMNILLSGGCVGHTHTAQLLISYLSLRHGGWIKLAI